LTTQQKFELFKTNTIMCYVPYQQERVNRKSRNKKFWEQLTAPTFLQIFYTFKKNSEYQDSVITQF